MRIQRQPPRNTGEGEAHATPHQRKERKGKHQRNSKQANTGRRHSKDSSYIPSVCTVVQNRRRPPVSQPESCHLRPNERSQKSGTDFETSRPGTLRLGRTEPYRRLRIRPYPPQGRIPTLPHRSDASGASVGTASPTTGGRNACAPPFAVCTNVPALIKESYLCHTEGGTTPALCHSQNERSRPRKRRHNIPNSNGKNARALQFSERATVSADADVFDRPLRFRITRREGKDEHPFPFVLESPIYKSFRRKKPAPALHTAIYHTRRKRRLTAAVRLSEQQAQPCLTGV